MKKLFNKFKTIFLKLKINSLDKNFYFYLMIGVGVLGLVAGYVTDELIKESEYRDGIIAIDMLVMILSMVFCMSKGLKNTDVSEDEKKIANDGMKIKLENEILHLSVPIERNLLMNQKKPFKI